VLCSRTGLANEFLPELNLMQLEQDPSTGTRTCSRTRSRSSPRRRRGAHPLAALLHDVGKPRTRGFGPQGVTFHITRWSARDGPRAHGALRYPNELVDDVSLLVELHLRFHTYRMGWTDSAVRRYVRDAGPLLDDLNELTRSTAPRATRARPPRSGAAWTSSRRASPRLREHEALSQIGPHSTASRS